MGLCPKHLRRKNVAGGSAPRPPLGAPSPRPPSWTGFGAEPQLGSGGRAPSYILAVKPPLGLGLSPNSLRT